jgi:hypothetical protein
MSAAALLLVALAGCNREAKAPGDSCTRSSECGEGLVCIDQACSDNLRALGARGGTVPMLMMTPAEPDMPAEAGVDAAAMNEQATPDASMMAATDAQMPAMQSPDAGP